MHKRFLCISNYSIDIIPHGVNLFCTQFDFCALFNLKCNYDFHHRYKLDIFLHPYTPFLLNKFEFMFISSLIVDTYKHG